MVDPPEVAPADTKDPESPSGTEWVRIDQMATLTLAVGGLVRLQRRRAA